MPSSLRDDVDLKPVVYKLGHKLEEIRTRALDNILSKLEHGLISDADLIQQQHLHIQLLEWFNYDKCPCKKEVLQLIQRLTKHDSAVKNLLEIGAIDFLSKLRADSENCLHGIIDDILENLLTLPSQDPPIHTRECIYQHHPQPLKERAGDMHELTDHVVPSTGQIAEPTMQQGYFTHTTNHVQLVQDPATAVSPVIGSVKGLKFSTFPWLSLTPTDRHVLTSTHSSLCSPRPSLVLTSCEFVSDVVLQDFPAEIFLQRPSITKSLLSLLGLKPLGTGDNTIPLSAIKCLRELSTLLLSRHRFYHDPALYCPKQDFGSRTTSSASSGTGKVSCSTSQSTLSSDSRPSVTGRNEPRIRGDGRDGDSPSSVGSTPLVPDLSTYGSDTDSEDAIILQFSQLTLPQFTTDVLVHVTPLLKTSNTEMLVASLYLLSEAVKLMIVSMTTEIWDDDSAAARALTDKLSESFETIGEVIHYHYQQCLSEEDSHSSDVSEEMFRHHRLSMVATVTLVSKLIQGLVPLKKASDILPESLSLSLYLTVMDPSLMYCIPSALPALLNIIEMSIPYKYELYKKTANISASMESACKFLKAPKSTNRKDLLNLAEASLTGLHYHKALSMVDQLVQLSSDICSSSDETEEIIRYVRKILLRFLAYPEADVQSQTYHTCLKIIKDVLSVNEAHSHMSDAAKRIHFLLDANILYEICCFGLHSAHKKVHSYSTELMLYLLQGQLLMGSSTWDMFLHACMPVLPLLQTLADKKSQLWQCIVGLLQPCISRDQSRDLHELPHLEKLRGSLRLLMCRDQSVRLDGARVVLYYITQDSCGSSKLPSIDTYTVNDVSDLLLMDHAISLDTQDNGRSVFQVESLLQVFGIFTSLNTEPGLRKSALEQIAIILQDASLHKAFVLQGGLDKILDCLRQATQASTDGTSQTMLPIVPACLCIVRHILHEDSTLRHQLAHQMDIYYLLIRGALLCYTNSRVRYHVAHLMVLLLFDEVATLSLDGNQSTSCFSLPKCVSQRFQLAFRCANVQSHSYHGIEPVPIDDPLVKCTVTWRKLKILWNVAWYDGIQPIISKIQSGDLQQSNTSFNSKLDLSKEDQLLLKCSHTSTSLSQCLQSIQEAASHYAVKVGLWRVSLWLLTDIMLHDSTCNGTINPDITETLLHLDIHKALARFLEVFPASLDDKTLLTEVLSFITLLMTSMSPYSSCTDFLHWLGNITCSSKSTLIGLLDKSKPKDNEIDRRNNPRQEEVGASAQRSLHKQLVAFFGCYAQCLPLSCEAWRRKTGYLGGSLTHGLLLSLNSADATHFYDLPSLENTLHSLVHITARPGWSLDWIDGDSLSLCKQLLNSLLEVVSAFHVGRGGTAMSFMGKGVTKSATVCLCHLAHEMAGRGHHKNWSSEWMYARQSQGGSPDIGLGWLIPLWSYRDPEVRAAGLGIATVLSSFESGCATLITGCQHLPGGLWAVTLGVLFDQSECSIVRQQAALLLNNLLSHHVPTGDMKDTWSGPHIQDEHTQVSVCGLPALNVLLEHYTVYQGIAASICNFYGQASIQPVSIVEDSTVQSSTAASSLSTATTADMISSQYSSQTTSPETVEQATTLNGMQSQRFTTWADSGQQSSAPLMGTSSSRCSSSKSRSTTVTSQNTAGRYISVVTPSLVSAFCHLLQNLLALSPSDTVIMINKEDIATSLIRLMDIGFISSLLHQVALSPNVQHSKTHLQLYGHLAMCENIMQFLQAYKQAQNKSNQTTNLDDMCVIVMGCKLLSLSSTDASGSPSWTHIHNVQESVLSMMLTHLTLISPDSLCNLMPVIIGHWKYITGAILHILKFPVASSTRLAALNFLAILMAKISSEKSKDAETYRQTECTNDDDIQDDVIQDMMHVLDDDTQDAGYETTSGSQLCSVLLQSYDGTLSRSLDGYGSSEEKTSIIFALRNLLSVSHQAKAVAIHTGLIESTLDSMQYTHAKLNVECLQHPRSIAKKKEEPLLLQLISQMGLLQNCLCNSNKAKMCSYEAGLASVLLKLWPWSILENRLLMATLSLLSVFTANCSAACSSLVHCPPMQSGSSLYHRIIKQVDVMKDRVMNSPSKDDLQLTSAIFAVLSNTVSSPECRNVLWKSGFLQNFSKVSPVRKQASVGRSMTSKQPSAALWLHLLANLTFSPEGQQMVMKIPDVLELLLMFSESTNDEVEYWTLLILHNLCFLSANKPKLLASEKMLSLFEAKLNCGKRLMQDIAVDAVWALLHASQKAKAILKSFSILQSLMDIHNKLGVIPAQSMASVNGHYDKQTARYQALSSVIALMDG